jgi:hypothetical protein
VSPNLPWQFLGTEDCLDRWQDRENPSPDLAFLVAEWLVSKMDDPHQGMRRVPEFPNLWFGKVARSDHGTDSVVVCSYEIDEATRTVRLRSIVTLSKPI